MNILLTIRDRIIFDMPLERAQETKYKCNKKLFLPKCPLSSLTLYSHRHASVNLNYIL
jgi:hypothetical protein